MIHCSPSVFHQFSRLSVVASIITLAVGLSLCLKALGDSPATTQASTKHTLPDGLIIDDVGQPSSGARVGDQVWVHYVLKLADGTEVDNSYKRGEPIAVTLGAGQVIKGWEEGLIGMEVGGKRKLTIPPSLGYGERGQSAIPPNATLYFDTEMVGIKR